MSTETRKSGQLGLNFSGRNYPDVPGYQKTDTSFAAAKSERSRAYSLRLECITWLIAHGPRTADEIADHLGKDRLAIRPRIAELKAAGEICDSGIRRSNDSGKTAIVWKVK